MESSKLMIGVASLELSRKFYEISGYRSLMVHCGELDGMLAIEPDLGSRETQAKTPAYDAGILLRLMPSALYFAQFELDGWFKLAKTKNGYQALYMRNDKPLAMRGWSFLDAEPENAMIKLLTKLFQYDVQGRFRG